jgi:hypothetical protein
VKPEGGSSHSLKGNLATKLPPIDIEAGTDPVGISIGVLVHGALMSGHEMSLLRSRLSLPVNRVLLLFSRRVEKAIADFLVTGSIE